MRLLPYLGRRLGGEEGMGVRTNGQEEIKMLQFLLLLLRVNS